MNNEQNFRKFCPIRPVLPHTPCFAPYALKGQKLLAQGVLLLEFLPFQGVLLPVFTSSTGGR